MAHVEAALNDGDMDQIDVINFEAPEWVSWLLSTDDDERFLARQDKEIAAGLNFISRCAPTSDWLLATLCIYE